MLNMPIRQREVLTPTTIKFQRRLQGRFLKGPIPWNAIAVASSLPGQALALFLAIHHRVALTSSMTVTLPKGLLDQLAISQILRPARCMP